MLETSPERDAKEWAIHDYEGFYDLRLSEWEGIEQVTALAAFTQEHGELGAELVRHFGGDVSEAKTAIEENYAGAYKTLADFAQELTEETTAIPQNLAYYIDYEAMAKDMELSGDVFTIAIGFEEVHVFWGR